MTNRLIRLLTFSAIVTVLAACGDSTNRGALLEAPVTLTTLTAAQIDASTAASGLQGLSGKAKCDVKVTSLYYSTPGVNGEASNASGVLLSPAGACTAAAP